MTTTPEQARDIADELEVFLGQKEVRTALYSLAGQVDALTAELFRPESLIVSLLRAERDALKANEAVLLRLVAEGVTLRNKYLDEIEELKADKLDFAKQIARLRPDGDDDLACSQCRPDSNFIAYGFVCVIHRAIDAAILATSAKGVQP